VEQRHDFVREKGAEWCVYSEDGVEIACHSTKAEAEAQLAAIESAKMRRQEGRSDGRRVVFRMDFARGDEGALLTVDERSSTPHRGLRIAGRISRVGVYEYPTIDLSTMEPGIHREYHPPEEVFAEDSLVSFADAPVTDLHPSGFVDPENWEHVAVGHVAGVPTKEEADGQQYVRAQLVLSQSRAIRRTATDERVELSPGYTVVVDETPGVTPDGQEFDAIAREIRANHVAIGPKGWARGGRGTRMVMDGGAPVESQKVVIDGVEHEVSAGTKQAVERLVSEREMLRGKVDSLDVALKAAQSHAAELDDPKRVQDAVRARVDLENRARRILGENERLEDFSDRQIMERALLKSDPHAEFDGMSDDYVRGRFDDAVKHAQPSLEDQYLSVREGVHHTRAAGGTSPLRFDDKTASRELAAKARQLWQTPVGRR